MKDEIHRVTAVLDASLKCVVNGTRGRRWRYLSANEVRLVFLQFPSCMVLVVAGHQLPRWRQPTESRPMAGFLNPSRRRSMR